MTMHRLASVAALLLPATNALITITDPAMINVAPTAHPRLDPRQACNGNNCLRALQNTKRDGKGDCSSYLVSTVTEGAGTVTVTVTAATQTSQVDVTETILTTLTPETTVTQTRTISPAQNKARQAGTIPDYMLSACSAAPGPEARFVSACSCIGVTATTITVPGPSGAVSTVYVTATITETVPHTETATRTADVITRTVTTDLSVPPTAQPTCARLGLTCSIDFYNLADFGTMCGGGSNVGQGCLCLVKKNQGVYGRCGACIPFDGFCSNDGDCCSGTCNEEFIFEGQPYGYCAN